MYLLMLMHEILPTKLISHIHKVRSSIEKPCHFFDNKNKRYGMKSMDKPKTAEKKKPQKTLKEKRAEKRAKKESKETE